MTLIYSNTEVEGLIGQYVEPFRFSGVEKGVASVYTDDTEIASAYSDAGVEVLPISNSSEQKTSSKKKTVAS